MAEIIQQIQKRMLVSLAQVAKNLGLREGDYVLIEERDGGIFIRPVGWHDKGQEYFWTKEIISFCTRSDTTTFSRNFSESAGLLWPYRRPAFLVVAG